MSIVDLRISYGIGLPESCYHKVVGTDGVLNDLGVGTNLKVYLWFKWGSNGEKGITKLLVSKKNEVPNDYHMIENSLSGNSLEGDDSLYLSYKKEPNESEITKLCLVLDNAELCIYISLYFYVIYIANEYTKIEPPLVTYKTENDSSSHSIYLCYSTVKQQIQNTSSFHNNNSNNYNHNHSNNYNRSKESEEIPPPLVYQTQYQQNPEKYNNNNHYHHNERSNSPIYPQLRKINDDDEYYPINQGRVLEICVFIFFILFIK